LFDGGLLHSTLPKVADPSPIGGADVVGTVAFAHCHDLHMVWDLGSDGLNAAVDELLVKGHRQVSRPGISIPILVPIGNNALG
jgi:hypothetical protein